MLRAVSAASGGGSIGSAITGATEGSVLFAGSGGALSQDNANFFWDDTKNALGLGSSAPIAKLHLAGNVSSTSWGSGIGIRSNAATYTDTSSSGTVSTNIIHALATPTLAASSVTTYTSAATFYITAAPQAGSNVTIANQYALWVDSGKVRFDDQVAIGAATIADSHWLLMDAGSTSFASSWSTNGCIIRQTSRVITDTASSGTVASAVNDSFAAMTYAASSATTYTHAANVYIAGAPSAGTNVTITNQYALWIDNGDSRFDGALSIKTNAAPIANLQLGSGNSQAAWGVNGAGLRIETGTFADTTSSGTVASVVAHSIAQPTISASNVTTYTTAASFYIGAHVAAGANVTITNPVSLWVDNGVSRFDGFVNIGGNQPTEAVLTMSTGNLTFPSSWGTTGCYISQLARTYTDGASSGTVASAVSNSFTAHIYAASSVTTFTNTATIYVAGPPTAGTNVTITNPYAIWVDSGNLRLDGNLDFTNAGGGNIVTDTTTGTKIGTLGGAAGQKLGFFNATPIVQPLLATGAGATVDNVITALQNLGLVRQS